MSNNITRSFSEPYDFKEGLGWEQGLDVVENPENTTSSTPVQPLGYPEFEIISYSEIRRAREMAQTLANQTGRIIVIAQHCKPKIPLYRHVLASSEPYLGECWEGIENVHPQPTINRRHDNLRRVAI